MAGVELPIGRPIIEEQDYRLGLRVRPNKTYGILLELKDGQVVVFFTTAVVTRPVLDTIRRELGDAPYSIERKTRDGWLAYEVDTWIRGRHIELNIYADGALRDRRDEMDLDELPEPVGQVARRHVGSRRLENIDKVTTARGVTYDVDTEERGRDIEYLFAEGGSLLRRHDD